MADRLLDAARECVIDIGWKRTTLTDVANRAGVSRMSVYRTYADMETLFAELMTREWTQVVAEVIERIDESATWDERLAHAVADSVTALREDALFRRALDLDPEWLLPYLLERRGRSQEALLALVSSHLGIGQEAGQIRDGDPELLARAIILAAHGHVISATTMTDGDIDTAALDHELFELVRRYLTP